MPEIDEKAAAPIPPVGAGREQPVFEIAKASIAEKNVESKPSEENLEELLQKMRRMTDPAYLPTVSMNDLYENIYLSTNGLLGAADGAFLLQKEKRTDSAATLDISGRDQQGQRLYLTRDMDHLTWQLERTETELWKPPPDPVLEAIAKLVTRDKPWSGTATELVTALSVDLKPNTLTMRLNVNAGRLLDEHGIRYENHRNHDGRKVSLTLVPPQA